MNRELDSEDRIILSLLEGEEATLAPAEDEEHVLHRLYAEVMGLLPEAIDPVAPPVGSKERLLAAIREAPARAASPAVVVAPASPPPPIELPPEALRGGPGGEAPRNVVPLARPPVPTPVRTRRWPLALAATIAALAVGAVFHLEGQRAASRLEVRRLERMVAERGKEQATLRARVAELEQAMTASNRRLAMVTEMGAEANRLEPAEAAPDLALARGILYVAGNHQHWFLKVTGLPRVADSQTYQLWFVTDQGPVSGGTFQLAEDSNAEIGSPTMPTGVIGVAITIEPSPGMPQPTGRRVLTVAQRMRLL